MDEPVIPEALLRSVDGSALSASGSQGVWSRLGQRWNDGPMVCTSQFLLEPTQKKHKREERSKAWYFLMFGSRSWRPLLVI